MPSRSEVAVIGLLAVVAGAGRLAVPLAVEQVLDHGSTNLLVPAALALGLAAVAAATLNRWLSTRTESVLDSRRRSVIEAVHRTDLARDRRSGDLVAVVTADSDAVSTFVTGNGGQLLVNTVQMVLALGLIAAVSWQVAVVASAVALILLGMLRRAHRVVAERFTRVQESVAALQGTIAEAVGGIEVIWASNGHDDIARRLHQEVDSTLHAQRRTLLPLHASTAFGEMAISSVTAGAVGLSAVGVVQTQGQLVAVFLLVMFFFRPMQGLVQSLGEAQAARAGWSRLNALAATAGAAGASAGVSLPAGALSVQLRSVTAGYGSGTPVLNGVDLDIAPGEHVVLVGPSGAGKSTLAKVATGELAPSEGDVRLGGVDTRDVAAESRRRIVVVPQDPFLFDTSVRANIGIAADRHLPQDEVDRLVAQAVHALRLDDWVDRLPAGLDAPVGPRGAFLSVGERQLVALARTALLGPDLLVLDEATAGIDPWTERHLQHAIDEVTRGCTTITIAHRSSALDTADRILRIDHGRLQPLDHTTAGR